VSICGLNSSLQQLGSQDEKPLGFVRAGAEGILPHDKSIVRMTIGCRLFVNAVDDFFIILLYHIPLDFQAGRQLALLN